MQIKVYAPAFIDHAALDPDGRATLPAGAKLRDLYALLKVPLPLRSRIFFSLNYEQARGNPALKDGDVVTFLFPISGG
jgi:molybdopterin converting factor small subunit